MTTSQGHPPSETAVPRRPWWIVGIVAGALVIGAVLVMVLSGHQRGAARAVTHPLPALSGAVAPISTIPTATFDEAGASVAGVALTPPAIRHDLGPLSSQGRTEVLSVCTEFSAFCAAERWPLVVALSRFGRFTALADSTSTPAAAFPSLVTFTFHDSLYISRYVTLVGIERFSNQTGANGAFEPLTPLDPAQAAVVNQAAPGGGDPSSPFIDVGGSAVVTTSGFSPALLVGQSQGQVVSQVTSPPALPGKGSSSGTSPPLGRAVLAVANQLSATICVADGQRPDSVCRSSGVRSADQLLGLPA